MAEAVAGELWDTVTGGFSDPLRERDARAQGIEWVDPADLFDPAHRGKATSKLFDLKWG